MLHDNINIIIKYILMLMLSYGDSELRMLRRIQRDLLRRIRKYHKNYNTISETVFTRLA